jgi:hypothetical protein
MTVKERDHRRRSRAIATIVTAIATSWILSAATTGGVCHASSPALPSTHARLVDSSSWGNSGDRLASAKMRLTERAKWQMARVVNRLRLECCTVDAGGTVMHEFSFSFLRDKHDGIAFESFFDSGSNGGHGGDAPPSIFDSVHL